MKQFYKKCDLAVAALKKILSKKCVKEICGPMSAKGLNKIIKKFEEIDPLEAKSNTRI